MKPVMVLVLSPVPEEGAGCRFRVCQYIPYLEAEGFRVTVGLFFTPEFLRVVYQKGRYPRKTYLFAKQALKRALPPQPPGGTSSGSELSQVYPPCRWRRRHRGGAGGESGANAVVDRARGVLV